MPERTTSLGCRHDRAHAARRPRLRAALAVMVIDIRKLNYARRILWKSLAYRAGSDYGLGGLKEKRQLKTRPLIAVVDAAWPQMDVVVACAHGSQSPPKGG